MNLLLSILPLVVYSFFIVIPAIAYAFHKDWQKNIDEKIIDFSKKLQLSKKNSFLIKYNTEIYTLLLNSFVASGVFLLNFQDSSLILSLVVFIFTTVVWFFALLLKIDFTKENIDNYTSDFFIAIVVGLLFSYIISSEILDFILFAFMSIITYFKVKR